MKLREGKVFAGVCLSTGTGGREKDKGGRSTGLVLVGTLPCDLSHDSCDASGGHTCLNLF